MGIFDRLGNLLKSYINTEDIPGANSGYYGRSGDPYFDEAYEELEGFLKGESRAGTSAGGPDFNTQEKRYTPKMPEEFRADFAELGVPFGASMENCKDAYKKLLKLHHPDRHAGHAGNMKKATEKSSRINAAFDRIEKWYRAG